MTEVVGAIHEFHDADYVRDWAERFVPTAPRLELFSLVLEQISRLGAETKHVVEPGIGPGYMARYILEREAEITYEGAHFSNLMFDVARATIGELMERVTLTSANLLDNSWPSTLSRQPGAIISTWALHDLGGQQAVVDVYARCFEALPAGGVLINGDFIKPEGTSLEYEPGRFAIARHFELLQAAGFRDLQCLAELEPNFVDPSGGQNYARLIARA